MAENDSQQFALESYSAAISCFRSGSFAKAHKKMREYLRLVDYGAFQTVDNRRGDPGYATVVIVTRDRGEDLIACLASLKNQHESRFETIVVDNGGSRSLRDVLAGEKMLLVECPIPFTPSEARNSGAFHARADLLIFLDDDGLAEPDFVKAALTAFEEHPFLGIRGRILPKSADADQSMAGLYDLGNFPLPALLDVEGNIAVPKPLYDSVNGMNPLLFGAEGLELTTRQLEANPDGEVYYWPKMVIRHDYASGDRLIAKRERQALVNEYFRVMHPRVLQVKERYAGIYRVCRKEEQGSFWKKLPSRVHTVGRDMALAYKSEKKLPVLISEKTFSKTSEAADDFVISQKEAKSLLYSLQTLEMELEITRKSITFRLGQVIRDALASPLRQGFLLPVRLVRLIKEYSRSDSVDRSAQTRDHVPGREMRNQNQYSQPGREEHVFTFFEEFQPYRNTCNSNLRIACILSPWMYSCLDLEAELIPLRFDDWQEVLSKKRPDFLLVQSLVEKSGLWQEACTGPDESPGELARLTAFCQKEKIPTVFWDTEDYIHYPLFSKTAPLFDHVFAADPKSVVAYGKLQDRKAEPLGPAIQPALHNPFKADDDRCSGFTLLMDGWADILEDPAAFGFLEPLLKEGLHIVDSRYRFMANKLDDLPTFRENIMGCVTYDNRLSALRHYRVLIMPDQSLSSSLARSWQALEAVACGCGVVISGNREEEIPEGIVFRTNDNTALREKALELLNEEKSLLRHSHRARRELYASHTYAHRIRTICKSLGIEHDWEEFPLVSVILPTKRPDQIQFCLENFHSQTYPSKELIIVVNTDEADMHDVQRMAAEFPNVRVFQMHQEKNIGTCLNFGFSQAKGEYWFKMDDDDFYGPNYLLDMVHLAGVADFDILGKPPAFIYLEDEDQVFLRNKAIRSQYTLGSFNTPHLCGATLGGRRDRYPGFSENHRACVDTGFVEDSKTLDRTLMFGDIWNFIAFRAGDKGRHTWRHDDEGIMKNAAPFCKGLGLEKVMI